MSNLEVKEEECLEYIKNQLMKASRSDVKCENAKYHHNTKYQLTSSIVKYGLLHLRSMNELGITSFSEEFLKKMGDTSSHINGDTGISLSVTGLTDIHEYEEEFDPYDVRSVDILIDSSIKAYRHSTNYANEYISFDNIDSSKFRAIDIRLLKLIRNYIEDDNKSTKRLEEIILDYNALIEIARSLSKFNLGIPLREMSYEVYELDVESLSQNEKLILK